jgi:hypothetical protein
MEASQRYALSDQDAQEVARIDKIEKVDLSSSVQVQVSLLHSIVQRFGQFIESFSELLHQQLATPFIIDEASQIVLLSVLSSLGNPSRSCRYCTSS